jgi:hypothetical protein
MPGKLSLVLIAGSHRHSTAESQAPVQVTENYSNPQPARGLVDPTYKVQGASEFASNSAFPASKYGGWFSLDVLGAVPKHCQSVAVPLPAKQVEDCWSPPAAKPLTACATSASYYLINGS